MNKKNDKLLYVCLAIFGILGFYLTFFAGSVRNFDSQAKAYRIDENSSYDSDDGTIYYPIYYFKVDGNEYKCKSKTGSSSRPNENKNTVYYDSKNPEKCKTEYEKSSGKLAGIICLAVTGVLLYFLIKGPSSSNNDGNQVNEINPELQEKIERGVQDAALLIDKVQLIIKRVILGVIILILLIFILIDTMIVKQTIKTKDYIDTTASYVSDKENKEDSIFNDYIYSFVDKKGVKQEIVVSVSKDDTPDSEIKIKYNENNPQDYYEEGSTYGKSEIIWYVVKLIILLLLVLLFFNKKLLSKISISTSSN